MSPEQVRGQPVDQRTDIFAFGCVLYEMLSGRRAFKGNTAAETMSAILNEDPGPPSSSNGSVPRALDRIAQRCLEKQPGLRFQSAKDIAFAIDAVSDPSGGDPASATTPALTAPGRSRRWTGVLAASAVALLALGAAVGRFSFSSSSSSPRVTRLTFERGTVSSARFATDGKTVVYGAAWGGEPTRIFQTRLGSPESTAVQLPDADLLAISATGELAISASRHQLNSSTVTGMSRAPTRRRRPCSEHVGAADWSRDSSVRRRSPRRLRDRPEYPIGTIPYERRAALSDPRIAGRGTPSRFSPIREHHDRWRARSWSSKAVGVEAARSDMADARGLACSRRTQEPPRRCRLTSGRTLRSVTRACSDNPGRCSACCTTCARRTRTFHREDDPKLHRVARSRSINGARHFMVFAVCHPGSLGRWQFGPADTPG